MRKLINLIIGIVLLLSATGCYVHKPIGYVSEPDYNKRVTVAQAGMVKRSTPIGITFKIGIIGAGAYGGYASQLIKFQTGNEQKPVDWANAALGAMAGVGVNTLIDLISGKGREKPVYDVNKWIRKANKDYLLLSGSGGKFTLIHSSIASTFQMKNLDDAKDFAKVFSPNSPHGTKVINMASVILKREEIPEFVNLYKQNSTIDIMAKRYLELSNTTAEVIDAHNKYDVLKNNLSANKAATLVSSLNDVNLYLREWKGNENNDLMISSLLGKCNRDEIPEIIKLFPDNNTSKLVDYYIINSKDIKSFFNALNQYQSTNKNLRQNVNLCDINQVKSYSKVLAENISYLGKSNFERFNNDLKIQMVECQLKDVQNKSLSEMYALAEIWIDDKWLSFANFESYKLQLGNLIVDKENRIEKERRVNELATLNKEDVNSLVEFCNKYPSTNESNEVAKLLNDIVINNVETTFSESWFATGDRGWTDDVLEENRDLFTGGNRYNYLRLGVLKNKSNYPLKLKVSGELNVRYNCGVSIIRTIDIDSYEDTDYFELQPGESYPFAFLFKNISEGTTMGKGLISAGCAYLDYSEKFNVTYFTGEIKSETLKEQNELIKQLVKNGNIKTKLSGVDVANQWADNFLDKTFGIKPTKSTILRVYFTKNIESDYNVTVNENGKNIHSKEVSSKKPYTLDFIVNPTRTYNVVIPEYGTFTINAKGRITQLIVDDDGEGRIDYQDED